MTRRPGACHETSRLSGSRDGPRRPPRPTSRGPTLLPMTISEIRCHRLTAPLHTPFVTALRRTEHLETTVVEVVDVDGVRGYGEAPQVWRVTGESLAGAEACLSGPLADVVRGRSLDDLPDLSRLIADAVVGNFGAKAAMDVALHDLAARRAGVSLVVVPRRPGRRAAGTHRRDGVGRRARRARGDRDQAHGRGVRGPQAQGRAPMRRPTWPGSAPSARRHPTRGSGSTPTRAGRPTRRSR